MHDDNNNGAALEPKDVSNWVARITSVDNLYHQVRGQKPFHVGSKSTRYTRTNEQVYHRWLTAKPDIWEPVDLGWLNDRLGMLIIVNKAKDIGHEPVDMNKCVLLSREGNEDDKFWIIPAGESFKGWTNPRGLVYKAAGVMPVRFDLYGIPD